jgi:hypothetical protein
MPFEIGQDKGQARPRKIFPGNFPKFLLADIFLDSHSRKPASLYNKFQPWYNARARE